MIDDPAIESRVLALHGVQARVEVFTLMQPEEITRVTSLVEWHWLAMKLPGERDWQLLGRRRTPGELIQLLNKAA